MTSQTLFRILTSEGLVSLDLFTIAQPQPVNLKTGCLLVVNQANGNLVTVHQTRLIPSGIPSCVASDGQRKSVCLKCGRVEGVVQEQIHCPYHHGVPCGLIEANA